MLTLNNSLFCAFGALAGEKLALYKEKPYLKIGAQFIHHMAAIVPIIEIISKKILREDKTYLNGFLKNISVGLTLGVTGVIILSPFAPFIREKGYLGSYDETEDKLKNHNFLTDKDYHDFLINNYTKRIHQLMMIVSFVELAFAIKPKY